MIEKELEIIDGCIKGCSRSQEILYKIFSKKMYAICLSYVKDEDSAKDVLQDGFVKVFNKISSFEKNSSIEQWIRRIIINTAIDYYRKKIKISWLRPEDIDESAFSLDETVLSSINERALLGILETLPEGCKMVFNLHVIEGYGHKEISEMIGVCEGTSKSQFFRAKKILKQKLEEAEELESNHIYV